MKILFCLTIFIEFLSNVSTGQNNAIVNLKQQLLLSKEDSSKVDVLSALSYKYVWSFADSSVIYGEQGLQLAQTLKYEEGEACCLYSLSIGFTTLGNYSTALNLGYKSLSLYEKLNDSSGMANIRDALGLCFREQGDYKEAIRLMKEAKMLNELLHRSTSESDGTLSSVYERNNQLDSALFYGQKGLRRI